MDYHPGYEGSYTGSCRAFTSANHIEPFLVATRRVSQCPAVWIVCSSFCRWEKQGLHICSCVVKKRPSIGYKRPNSTSGADSIGGSCVWGGFCVSYTCGR
ncbi:hypothetical protein JOB18_039583 [Solea senegalensis]|uniref:Uncharacterized protein n=1 Tax=Solea senegalensis TaxID=28829 RepID=A0AAV6SBL9_SOLSE|nr:hypothetical protein JOB18_039583 [Solea senegalensis]